LYVACLLSIATIYIPRLYDISFVQKHLDYSSNFDSFKFDHFIARLIRVAGKVQKDAAFGDLISRFHLPLDQLATTLRIGKQNVFCDHFSLFIPWVFFSKLGVRMQMQMLELEEIARRRRRGDDGGRCWAGRCRQINAC
jgi:hypothetical protein